MSRYSLEDIHPDLDVREEMNQGRMDDAAAARRDREALQRWSRKILGIENPDPAKVWNPEFPPPPF